MGLKLKTKDVFAQLLNDFPQLKGEGFKRQARVWPPKVSVSEQAGYLFPDRQTPHIRKA